MTVPVVVNIKDERWSPRTGVYIGRPSKWGNPYKVGRDGDIDMVLRKYYQHVLSRPDLLAALPELKGKVLGCYCKPKQCHGDVLVWLYEQRYTP